MSFLFLNPFIIFAMMRNKNDSKKRFEHGNGDVSIVEKDSISVVTFTAGEIDLNTDKSPSKQTVKKPDINSGINKWFPWGEDDNFPEKLLGYISKIGVAETAIDNNADLHFGAGIEWFSKKYEGPTISYEPQEVESWVEFLERTNFMVAHAEALQHLETYYMAFIEFILTKDKKNIYSVKPLDPLFCRFKKNDSGKPTHIFFIHDINGSKSDHDEIPIFNAQKLNEVNKFVLPIKYPCPGMPYYSKPNFNTLIENGWADVLIEIPKYIRSIYKNQSSLKYHIKIPLTVFRAKYKDWDSKDEKEQIRLQDDYKTMIDNAITGAEKAGVSVMSIFDDENMKEPITIEPIKNLLETTAELPNAFAANAEVLFAYSIDPSLLGMVPGGKGNLAGSGSDKRESRENRQKNLKRERLISLQILKVISLFLPNFPKNLIPMYIDADNSQTLDKNPTGSKNVVV